MNTPLHPTQKARCSLPAYSRAQFKVPGSKFNDENRSREAGFRLRKLETLSFEPGTLNWALLYAGREQRAFWVGCKGVFILDLPDYSMKNNLIDAQGLPLSDHDAIAVNFVSAART